MRPETPSPDFDAKVRFSRVVEGCLWEPEVPEAPHLLARVRARVALEQLRRRRRGRMRRTVLTGATAALVMAAVEALMLARAQAAMGRALISGPLAEGLRACVSTASSVSGGLPGLGLVGTLTLACLAVAALLYPVRDLFVLDPLRGLTPSARRLR